MLTVNFVIEPIIKEKQYSVSTKTYFLNVCKKGYGQALGYSNFHNAFLAPFFVISRKSVIDVCNFRAIYPESVTPNPRMVNYLTQKITKPGLSTISGLDKVLRIAVLVQPCKIAHPWAKHISEVVLQIQFRSSAFWHC